MSSTALKVVAAISVLLAIVLAVLGYQISKGYAKKADDAAQQVRQQKVEQFLAVVAIKPLPAYQVIARDAVALVPVSIQPAASYASIDDVAGKVPLVDVDAGAPVTQRYFKEGNVLARVIPPGHQAVSVEINDVIAVGGFVRPGDIVDLLLFLRGGNGAAPPQSRVLLEAVRVLAYEERIIDRPEGLQEDERRQQRRSRTAVLSIPEAQTTKLMLGVNLGELRLALHSQALVAANEADDADSPSTAARAPARSPRPDKAISMAELVRLGGGTPSAGTSSARIEVIRGSQREAVSTK